MCSQSPEKEKVDFQKLRWSSPKPQWMARAVLKLWQVGAVLVQLEKLKGLESEGKLVVGF